MPVSITKKGSKFEVKTPNEIHSKGTTKKKAEAQKRLLNAVEHGWKPTGKKSKSESVEDQKLDQTVSESAEKIVDKLIESE